MAASQLVEHLNPAMVHEYATSGGEAWAGENDSREASGLCVVVLACMVCGGTHPNAHATRVVTALDNLRRRHMIQINIGDHTGSENNIPFNPIPERWRANVKWARERALLVSQRNPKADRYFRSLPRGRTFSSLVSDSSIWINYFNRAGVYGFTFTNSNLWLCDDALQRGRWVILATLVHELAHIGGAIGGIAVCSVWSPPCHAAERAVLECGLGTPSELKTGSDDPRTPYEPGIAG